MLAPTEKRGVVHGLLEGVIRDLAAAAAFPRVHAELDVPRESELNIGQRQRLPKGKWDGAQRWA